MRKAAVLLLIGTSLVLLWWDRKQDLGKGEGPKMMPVVSSLGEVD